MTSLREYYDRLLELKFPGTSIEDDDFADFYSELVEVDGYYAGIIKTALEKASEQYKNIDFTHLEKLRKQFDNIDQDTLSQNDKIIYKECGNYLAFLEELPSVVIDS